MATRTFAASRDTIDPARWDRLKTILDHALQQPTSRTRAASIRKQCARDSTLLQEAQSLLAAAESLRDEPTDWLESGAEKATGTLWDDDSSRAGERIGAYVLVRQIGRGGMGAVYLAERADGEFKKEVAIKLLKRGIDTDEVLRRFRTERQIVARLEHPNIARLLDAGTTSDGLPYFVMENVAGVPVTQFIRQQELPIAARLELFLKICSAVELAHQAGVVHRDLKARNILIAADGEPKLLDFGIAKLLAPEESEEDTAAGRQHLTPQSASPEQVRGEAITLASDVYALGALLYEMLTDRSPHRFSSPNPPRDEVQRVVCDGDIVPPTRTVANADLRRQLRGDLDNIVRRAMRKAPSLRYPSVAEFADDIRSHLRGGLVKARPATWAYRVQRFAVRNQLLTARSLATAVILFAIGAGVATLLVSREKLQRASAEPATEKFADAVLEKSVAVLPFQNLSGESENAFFAAGVQDAILTDLTKIADLKVINRMSVQQYASDTPRDLHQISQQLRVAYILEGSVQRADNRVRVNVTLTDARTNAQTWAERYDRDLADVFAIQSEVARKIASQLRATLSSSEHTEANGSVTHDIVAYDLYLRAKELGRASAQSSAMVDEQVSLLDQSVARDPNFVPALCLLSRTHSKAHFLNFDRSPERLALAQKALTAATRLAPQAGEVYLAEAIFHYWGSRDYSSALRTLTLARRSLPSDADVLFFTGLIERRVGRPQESTEHMRQAASLDPYNPMILLQWANNHFGLRRYEEAARILDSALEWRHDDYAFRVARAVNDLAERADMGGFQEMIKDEALKKSNPELMAKLRVDVALTERDYQAAEEALAAYPGREFGSGGYVIPREYFEGVIAQGQGNMVAARSAFQKARSDTATRVAANPKEPEALVVLADIDAWMGQAEEARRESQRVLELLSLASDATVGPEARVRVAAVYARLGDLSPSLDILEQSAQLPFGIDYGRLVVDEEWDSLRSEPRFQQILHTLAPAKVTR